MKISVAAAAVSLTLLLAGTGLAGDSQAEAGAASIEGREAAARTVVDTALAELLAVLANEELSSEQRLGSIEKIVREHFDLAVTARSVLGKARKRLSAPENTSYVCEFDPYLSNYIGSRFGRYEQEKIETISAELGKRLVVVRTRILGGRFDRAIVDFRMYESDDQWRAVDVVFEGVSAVRTLRAQFQEVLAAGGPEQLLQWLREQNAGRSDC